MTAGSARSTQTSTLPPQASPTSHAFSLETPKCRSVAARRRGGRACASFDHRGLDAAARHRADELAVIVDDELQPGGRGDDPHVLTTVASATPRALGAPRRRLRENLVEIARHAGLRN